MALENNLDLAIARYNLPIANTDILRTKAGGIIPRRQHRCSAGHSRRRRRWLWIGRTRRRSRRHDQWCGWRGRRRVRIGAVNSGYWNAVQSYDPLISGTVGAEHQTTPLANQQIYGVPSLQSNIGQSTLSFAQAFPTGTSFTFQFNNNRQTANSPFFNLNPVDNSMFRFAFQQQLLAGFGFGPNLRFLRIAKNNKKISDIAFKDQVIATVTQIENIYWDLVSAYEQSRVNEQSLNFAQQAWTMRRNN